MDLQNTVLILVLAPLAGALLAGLFGRILGRSGSHRVTILGVAASFAAALWLAKLSWIDGVAPANFNLYTWAIGGSFPFHVGFLIDKLAILMFITVTFVSLLVHIYTIGYMVDDPGYQRFFSYISLFTFSMLMLVGANNFVQLFFGWEAVGVVSYLLIGFWFQKESALQGALKAFVVNRVGDFGFLLGIAAVLQFFGTLDYAQVFQHAGNLQGQTISLWSGHSASLATVICLLLFVGAMGKSAQVPLHVWLPESMEGPTPISALIHAATMVTAGIYMIVRMSPIYAFSPTALSVILVIGATGALFMGLLGLVQNDIKRVVAYSTLSQLGYMMAGVGASAYAAAMFHLITHACFKALLFLGAGSVIIAMHHEQDMRKMGGLWRYMPITYVTSLIGSLALCGIPPFSGFFSKDMIIEAVHDTAVPGASYAYICVLLGVVITALYTFRSFLLTFHTRPRMDQHTREHLKESPWVVWLPLVCLAIPSIGLGAYLIGPLLFDQPSWLSHAIVTAPHMDVLARMGAHFHGPMALVKHSIQTLPFWLAVSGIVFAWLSYIVFPEVPAVLAFGAMPIRAVLVHKYGFDRFNDWFFVRGGRGLAQFLSAGVDRCVIDNGMVNGSARLVAWSSRVLRVLQSGFVYHYASIMVLGLVFFLWWLL